MNSTTTSKSTSKTIANAKVITTTLDDLQSGLVTDMYVESRKISKQIRFIRDLYSKFPDVVVAGGCPLNHLYSVAAKDIDIFVRSEEQLNNILSSYNVVSCVPLGNSDAYQDSTMSAVYEVFITMGSRPVYKLHLNIIVMREGTVHSSIESRLGFGKVVRDYFPLRASQGFYSEVYGNLYLIMPSLTRPMLSNRPCDAKFTEKTLRKGLVLSRLASLWGRGTPNTPLTGSWLATGFTNFVLDSELRNCFFFPVNQNNTIRYRDDHITVFREGSTGHSFVSFADVTNIMWMNDYATSSEKYNALYKRPAPRSTLGQQAASLVSAMQSRTLQGADVLRSLTSEWVSTGRTLP